MGTMILCSIEGCGSKHHARGLCSMHYGHKWRAVNPEYFRKRRIEYYREAEPTGYIRQAKDGTRRGLGRHPLPASVCRLSLVEAAWLGAFIDGEGTIGVYDINRNGLPLGEISVANTEPELISAVLRITRVGTVWGRFYSLLGSRPSLLLRWKCNRQNDVKSLVRQLAPYCLKAQRVLPWVEFS